MNLLYNAKRVSLVCLALLAFGCKKGDDNPTAPEEKGDFKITFVKSAGFELSKATSNNDFFAEPGHYLDEEKYLSNIVMYVYKKDEDVCILRHKFTQHEINKKTAIFSLPSTETSPKTTEYDFYVIANHDAAETVLTATMSRTDLQALTLVKNDIDTYNKGVFEDAAGIFTATSPKLVLGVRSKGFTMVGMASAKAAGTESGGAATDAPRTVDVKLSRLVNKIAVRTRTTDKFHDKYEAPYGSTLKIKEVRIKNIRTKSILVPAATFTEQTAIAGETVLADLMQTPSLSVIDNQTAKEGKYWDAMFYSFENGGPESTSSAPSTNKPQIEVVAEYDFDGDGADNVPIEITYKAVAVDGHGSGLMIRNGMYKIDVKINGLTPQEVVATFEIVDWVTPATQTVNFGG